MTENNQAVDQISIRNAHLQFFYDSVANVRHTYAQYINLLLKIKKLYQGKQITQESYTEEESKEVELMVGEIRYHVINSYRIYCSLIKKIGKAKKSEEIEKVYDKIKNDYIIEEEDLDKYLTILDDTIVDAVMDKMLETKGDVIQKMF